nr:MAG TPA: minor tail protein [Caudoviricetes sp.]
MSLLAERELTWKLNTDTGKATSDIQNVDKELDKVKSSMEDIDKKSGLFSKFGGALKSAGTNVKGFGSNIQSIGGNIAKSGAKMTALTAPLTLGLKKGVEGALELDTAIRQVTTLADKDVLPVGKIEQEVKRISNATGIAQTEISESMYSALSAGVDSSNVVDFVNKGVKLTKAGFTDMPTVIDATTTALNAYGQSGAEAISHIQDVFVKTQDLGKITVDELGKNIGRVVPFASAAGVSIDQLGAGYSILTAKGQNAAIATTNLSALISELNTTGSTADKALRKSMGQSFKEMMNDGKSLGDVLQSLDGVAKEQGLQLGDMFGNKMATSAANTLLADGPDQFNNALDTMQNSSGAVDKNYKKMQGPEERLQIAQNKLKNSFIEMGGALEPVIEQIAGGIQKLADKFNGLSDEAKGKIARIAGVIAIAGPIITAIGTTLMVVGGAIKMIGGAIALLASPIGLVVAGIAAVIAIGYILYQNWDMIKQKAIEVWDGIKLKVSESVEAMKLKFDEFKSAISEKFEGIKASVSAKFEGMKLSASNAANSMKSHFASFADSINGRLGGAIESAKGKFNSLKGTATNAINAIKGAWERLRSALSKPINAVVNIAKGAAGAIKSKLPGHADGLYRVPYDEYPAMLHKDEMVVTAQGSSQLRAMGANENGFSTPPTSSMMGDLRPSVTNNESSTSNNSSFSPVLNITMNSAGDAKTDANIIADVVKEELMQLFMTANLQRG